MKNADGLHVLDGFIDLFRRQNILDLLVVRVAETGFLGRQFGKFLRMGG